MKSKLLLRQSLLALGSVLLAVSAASAQTWDGATSVGTYNFDAATNWNPDGVPNAVGASASLNNDITGNQTINLNQQITLGSLTLGDSSGAQTMTLGAGTAGSLVFDQTDTANALLTRTSGGTGGVTLSSGVTLNDNLVINPASGGITISGIISGVGGISVNGLSGNAGITLAGNNTYSGVTAIVNRNVTVSNANALGSSAAGSHTTITYTGGATSGARLFLSGNITVPENITITGSDNTGGAGFNPALGSSSGTSTFSGTITLTGTAANNTIRIGTGTTIFSGTITQSGMATNLGLQGTTTVNNPMTLNGNAITVIGSSSVVTLKGVNGSGIGNAGVAQGGTLVIGVTDALNTTANLTIGSFGGTDTGTFRLNGFNQTVNALISTATGATRVVHNNSATTASTLTVGNGGGSGTFTGTIVNGGAATLAITKVGGGTQTLGGANTYTGATTINGGTLKLGANNVLPNASNVSIGAATLDANTFTDSVGTLDVTDAAVINLGTGAAIAFADSKAIDWTGGTLNITGTLGATSLRFGDSADDLTPAQLALISVNGGGTYALDASGYLVPASNATPYDTWAGEKGLTVSNNANNLDPDGDGNNNLAEFAFNGNPLSGSDNGKVFVLTADSDVDGDTTNELILTVAVRTGTPAFTGSPTPSAVNATDGITYNIEGSLDLSSSAAVSVVPTPVTTGLPAAGAGYEYRSFSLDGSNGLSGKGFLRAKVTAP